MDRKELKIDSLTMVYGYKFIMCLLSLFTFTFSVLGTGTYYLLVRDEKVILPITVITVSFVLLLFLVMHTATKCFISFHLYRDSYCKVTDVTFGVKQSSKVISIFILKWLAITIGIILLIVPGIYLYYAYSQAYYILSEDSDKSAYQCLRESRVIMKGYKFEFFKLQLSFIGWDLLSIVTAGIALLYVYPYKNVTYAAFYLNVAEQQYDNVSDLRLNRYFDIASNGISKTLSMTMLTITILNPLISLQNNISKPTINNDTNVYVSNESEYSTVASVNNVNVIASTEAATTKVKENVATKLITSSTDTVYLNKEVLEEDANILSYLLQNYPKVKFNNPTTRKDYTLFREYTYSYNEDTQTNYVVVTVRDDSSYGEVKTFIEGTPEYENFCLKIPVSDKVAKYAKSVARTQNSKFKAAGLDYNTVNFDMPVYAVLDTLDNGINYTHAFQTTDNKVFCLTIWFNEELGSELTTSELLTKNEYYSKYVFNNYSAESIDNVKSKLKPVEVVSTSTRNNGEISIIYSDLKDTAFKSSNKEKGSITTLSNSTLMLIQKAVESNRSVLKAVGVESSNIEFNVNNTWYYTTENILTTYFCFPTKSNDVIAVAEISVQIANEDNPSDYIIGTRMYTYSKSFYYSNDCIIV